MSVFAVGVGPGSPKYVTRIAEEVISGCNVVAGYEYTLNTIRELLDGKEVHRVTMANQEEAYQRLHAELGDRSLVVPFTGDVNFSESEVVDRLIEIFDDITLIPGISSVQVALARVAVPMDKARIISMHVTSSIEKKKQELLDALANGQSVALVPRPWPGMPEKHFMPSEIVGFLRENGVRTESLKAHVFESLTTDEETHFESTAAGLEGREFSAMSVVVFDQSSPDSYMNYEWQWGRSP